MMKLMGRNSKTEQSNETTPSYKEQSSNSSSFNPAISENGSAPSPTNLESEQKKNFENESLEISASETMAKEIEEGRLSGYVGHGTTLAGETSFQVMLRVDGHLTGKITSEEGTLIVGTKGLIDANILVATAIINGKVNGDIVATKKLQLVSTAQVVGNVQAPRLVLEDGAILEGNCSMIKAKENSEKGATESKSQPNTNKHSLNQADSNQSQKNSVAETSKLAGSAVG